MKNVWTLVLVFGLVSACDNNDVDISGMDTSPPPSGVTHHVCAFGSQADDDTIHPRLGINTAEDTILIESMSAAPEDIDYMKLAEEDQMLAGFAVTTFAMPTFADAFSTLLSTLLPMLICNREHFDLNRCNWDLSDSFFFEYPLQVQTEFHPPKGFTSTIMSQPNEGDDWQTVMVAEGFLDDLGNGKHRYYENGVQAVTRTFSRTSNGTETISYASVDSNWTATEDASCNGSLKLEQTKDTEQVTLDAQWVFSGKTSSGKLVFVDSSWDAPFKLTW